MKSTKIELTEAQAWWLMNFLWSGTDGFFEGSPRDRAFNDRIQKKVATAWRENYK